MKQENNLSATVDNFWDALMKANDELNSFFAIGAYPTSIFVDSSGSVQLMRTGALDSAELEEILASLE